MFGCIFSRFGQLVAFPQNMPCASGGAKGFGSSCELVLGILIIMLYYVVLRCTMLCYVVLWCTTLYYVVQCCTTLYYVVLCCATLYYVVLCCTTLYCVVLGYTKLYYVVLCCTMLYYVALHCTALYYVVLRSTTLYYVLIRCTALYVWLYIFLDFGSLRHFLKTCLAHRVAHRVLTAPANEFSKSGLHGQLWKR